MEQIYIALIDTPGLFADVIRKVTGLSYVHVALSLDSRLEETYSIGRRNPFIPVLAGFEREDKRKILRAFPTAEYQVSSLPCSKYQKEELTAALRKCYEKRFFYHYCILGLPFVLAGRPFYQRNHYTCSSFLARLLEEQGILTFGKHFSLVTPRDFYEIKEKTVIFEGN